MSSNLYSRILLTFLICPPIIILIFLGKPYFYFLMLVILIVGMYEIINLKKNLSKIIILFIFFCFLFFLIKIENSENGKYYLFFILFITSLSDTGGYVIGKNFGKKKIGVISKNKTFEGFVGSILFSQFSILFMNYYNFLFFDNYVKNFLLIIFLTTTIIIGDLFFSYIKRINNIKDYSSILKGHGGLFDRIDGLIFCTIFFSLIFNLK